MKLSQLTVAAAGAMSLCLAASAANAADYLIGSKGANQKGLEAQVAEAGGTLTRSFPFGLAVASSDDPEFASKLQGIANIQFAVEDVGFDVEFEAPPIPADFGYPPNSGDDDFFFDLQWGHNYVGAQEAWTNGHFGQGVNVAVLDGGFDLDHPDIAPNLYMWEDITGQGIEFETTCPGNPFSHGNHVAGTIAAADNAFGTIGVAPQANLMLVKVLQDTPPPACSGSGSFIDIITGIVFATDNGAHVINMSLGTVIPRQGLGGDNRFVSELKNAVNKAITYAHQNGTTVIVSAGNAGSDLDGGDKGAVRFNTGMSHAVGISALAPQNWAGEGGGPLYPAGYTNFGTSMVDFGAPGGDVAYPGNEGCVVAGLARPCWVFDLVFSTGSNGSWYWSAGTSMAAPHAAGVAALIISETGDSRPDQVIREMRARATDAGKPGRDDYYGFGIANSGN